MKEQLKYLKDKSTRYKEYIEKLEKYKMTFEIEKELFLAKEMYNEILFNIEHLENEMLNVLQNKEG